jgi:hypothetical protein
MPQHLFHTPPEPAATTWNSSSNHAAPVETAVETLLEQLDGGDAQTRQRADQELAALGPQAIKPLAAGFQRALRRHQSRQTWSVAAGAFWMLTFSVWLLLLAPLMLFGDPGPFLLTSVLLGLNTASCIRLSAPPTAAKRAARLLIRSDDLYALPALITIFDSGGATFGDAAAKEPLVRQLERLQRADPATARALLDEKSRETLRNSLALGTVMDGVYRYKYDAPYLRAALGALAHVGDAETLPIARQLARDARDVPVRQAAEACVARLQGHRPPAGNAAAASPTTNHNNGHRRPTAPSPTPLAPGPAHWWTELRHSDPLDRPAPGNKNEGESA